MTLKSTFRMILLAGFITAGLTGYGQLNMSRIASSQGYLLSQKDGILSKMKALTGNRMLRDTSGFDFHTHAGKGINIPLASVTDTEGNTYVTGTGSDPDSHRGNLLTIKVNAQGTLAWEKRLPGTEYVTEIGMAIALDASGNPVVSGMIWNGHDADMYTMKLDAATGNTLWEHTFAGSAEGLDVPSAIAIAADGSCVVTGVTYTGANVTWVTVKLGADGQFLWTQAVENNLPDSWIEPADVHISENGNIGITGYHGNSEYYACYYTTVYNSQGVLQWEELYEDETMPAINSKARGITADGQNNWYITGSFNTMDPIMRTLKYNAAGEMQWFDSQIMAEEWSDGYEIETGTSGLIYAAGRHFGNWTDDGTVLIAFNADGTRAWTELTNDLIDPRPVKLDLDQDGNPAVAGWGTNPDTWNNLIKAIKYSPGGVELSQAVYEQTSSEFGGISELIEMEMDEPGNAYFTFTGFYTNMGSVFEVMKLPFGGTPEWDYLYHNESSSRTQLLLAFTDAGNNTYASGFFDTITDNYLATVYLAVKYNPAGEVEWEKQFSEFNGNPANGIQIRASEDGNVAVLLMPGFETPYRIKMFNTDGDSLWGHDVQLINPAISSLMIDNNNNLYLAGSAYENEADPFPKFVLVKYSSTGETEWVSYADRDVSTDESFRVSDATIGQSGEIYLTGSAGTAGWFDATFDMVVLKFSPSGDLSWISAFPAENTNTEGRGLLIDDQGAVYVNGYSENRETFEQQVIVYKLDSEGSEIWSESYGQSGRRMMSYESVLRSTGHLLVSAFSVIDGLNNKVVIIEYDENGNQTAQYETDYFRFYYDMFLDAADNLYVLNQVAGEVYPFRPSFSAGGNPFGSIFTVEADGTTSEELFPGPELSDFYPASLVPLADGRLLLAGTVSNEFSMFEGMYFFQSDYVVSTGNQSVPMTGLAGQNIPNPATHTTVIPVFPNNPSHITVSLFDLTGRHLSTPFSGELTAGRHEIGVNVKEMNKGVYMYVVSDGVVRETRKMVVK